MTLEKRILVVDDDDTIRALLRTVLRRRGFRVDSARNGVEALERMTRCRYSLIVLDLMMPRMSGYEMLEHLTDAAIRGSARVLVLTAGIEPRVLNTDFVVGTIHKPFDIELFIDAVSGYLAAVDGLTQLEECAPGNDAGDAQSSRPN
jgi:CheY-like chemotaxis protein